MAYDLLPVPPPLQGPSGEAGQVLIHGVADRVTLFHGRVDDECDWHVYIRPDPGHYPEVAYCEIMVLDGHTKPVLGDDKFYTADLSAAFRLVKDGSANPAWDVGQRSIDEQGASQDVSTAGVTSRLVAHQGRVYLQGAYVNDTAHRTRVEIHPLDSIAFAIDDAGQTLAARAGEAGWPTTSMRWRVAYLANSSLHRINDEGFVDKERTTTWLLDLPQARPLQPVFRGNLAVTETRLELRFKDTTATHHGRGVESIAPYELVIDPSDGQRKLKVGATMSRPDEQGGIVVLEYRLRFEPPVLR